jgi:hypothetical protein
VVHIKGSAGHQVDANQKSYIKEYFSDCGAVTGLMKITFQKMEFTPIHSSIYKI